MSKIWLDYFICLLIHEVLNLGQTIKIKREREVLSNEADVEKSNHLNPIDKDRVTDLK